MDVSTPLSVVDDEDSLEDAGWPVGPTRLDESTPDSDSDDEDGAG